MLGLQLSPFLDFLGVVFQMGAHNALHEARQIGAPVSQSTDNEVGALLCRPTQIDRPTICQLDRNKEGLLVSLQCPSLHFGAEAFRRGCTVGRRSQTSTWPFAERRRRRRTRRLVCFNKRLQRQLQEMRPLMGSEQTQRLRRALQVCPPRKGTLEKK